MSTNLLVIDWDYFFYNPLYATDGHDPRFWLFDWGHNENMVLPGIWSIRAAGFLQNGFELPQVDIPEGFWDRFNIADDAVCEVSDSNMYSGVVGRNTNAPTVFDHVWLFDAHHDVYRVKTLDDLEAWADEGAITCEDWMFAHYVQGSKLHWRWPRWFTYGKKMRATEIPKWLHMDARRDDLGKIDMRFDAVSICRSGAWVPPWCDAAFERFIESCPAEIVQVQDGPLVREWDDDEAARYAEQISRMMAEAKANGEHEIAVPPVVVVAKEVEP